MQLIMVVLYKKIKYAIVRLIEKNPHLNLFVYDKILYFPFFLPHEKDYYGTKLLLKNNKKNIFLDVGANNGMSTRGFRKLGFKNPIYVFEPNKYLYIKYLQPLTKKILGLKLFNFGLGNKNSKLDVFTPYLGKKSLHFMTSYDKKYILDSTSVVNKDYHKNIKLKKTKFVVKKFDSLKINKKIDFIKMDIEGYEHEALKGMKKTIQKNKPIFLIEFNYQNFKKVCKVLNNYNAYIYNFQNNYFKKIDLDNLKKNHFYLGKQNRKNMYSSRNLYFIHKKRNIEKLISGQ